MWDPYAHGQETSDDRLFRCVAVALVYPAHPGSLSASKEEYKARRQLYLDRVHDGVTVVFNAPETEDEFVVRKDFYYLTGFSEPGAILVLSPNEKEQKETLFIPEKNPDKERWTGPRLEAGPRG